jgi:nicotinate-nucleotide adenylyltransferase
LPPHRAAPAVTSELRAQMLRLALANCPELLLDTRELARATPSYSYDTLCELRAELGPEASINLCMGADAVAGLAQWHRWQELPQLANLVVLARPGWRLPQQGPVAELLALQTNDVDRLGQSAAGLVVSVAPRLLPISATEIRALIGAGQSPQFLLPEAVWQFIQTQGLYR